MTASAPIAGMATIRLIDVQRENGMLDLVEELRSACQQAPPRDKVVTIHLFGIRNALRLRGVNMRDFAASAGVGKSFGPEIYKGVRLSEFVKII